MIYGKPVPHAHSPGGLDDYLLCDTHEAECLKVHRPIAADGTWRWVYPCADPACGYCAAYAAQRATLVYPPETL
jgi:hypothetical protein